MAGAAPEKADIDAIFNRLRSIPTNKTCFDCGAKNPTWSSVTYGVFICIDCSAVHRGLGVHLTFVRSTNLDTNWTWLQIRQMQVGGNAKAGQFFRQHNCNSNDAQQKYTSRTAQLYRDKLANLAQQSLQLHGNTLHIDGVGHEHSAEGKKTEEVDFFADCEGFENQQPATFSSATESHEKVVKDELPKGAALSTPKTGTEDQSSSGQQGPTVNLLNCDAPLEPHKPTIGVRKIQPKKGGLGGKKAGGLGATRVKTNFAEIEEKANMADKLRLMAPGDGQVGLPAASAAASEEEIAQSLASVRLAYQDLSRKQHREEEKLKAVDPNKAKQMERLGMGFGSRAGVSHSVLTDMKTLTPDTGSSKSGSSVGGLLMSSKSAFDSGNDFFDDYDSMPYGRGGSSSGAGSSGNGKLPFTLKDESDLTLMGFETIEPFESKHNIQTMFSPTASSKNTSISDQPTYSRNNNSSSSSGSKKGSSSGADYEPSESAQKKFGGAKGISSDQFFGQQDSAYDSPSANLAKFQGSNSISSADYFGHGNTTGSGGSGRSRGPNLQYNGPDLDDVKESVRQSVTKVAGRLSNLANDVMSSIQDKVGY